ncbi:MAG: 3'(2'),5'-bisphosphate nucleotidase CysQ [Firmicutes bacterium]|nr:3'(2'),5'-bisphosphate nucleotidase CysQ [Alicyclobacillaceae bacterium]MCL6498230.1 3'(2'),5'-bisphosphate nucleotidase CysQ [Bacillota bacterium]
MHTGSDSLRLRQRIDPLLELSAEVRTILRRWWRHPHLPWETKADGSPVTAADREVHATVAATLARLWPDEPVVSEEDGGRFPRHKVPRYWLVDPLDGTRDFLAGGPDYVFCLALIADGEPVLGLIDWPAADRTYWAVSGHGAAVWDGQAHRELTPAPRDPSSLVVAVSAHHGHRELAWLRRRRVRPTAVLERGSALKFCLVADGTADLYLTVGGIHTWDVAAGHCLVAASGGAVTDLKGRPLPYSNPLRPLSGVVAWSRGEAPLPWLTTPSGGRRP